ncbi:MAG: hypothetical protein RQ753_08375, partial [Desulfurivibrionaceae bacterium]|nr:hypothetical protein [Desulfurivibrionaceae bacterium]
GWFLKTTGLSDTFTFDDYLEYYSEGVVPMFAVNPKGRLKVFTAEEKILPGKDWAVTGLVPPAESGRGDHKNKGKIAKASG